MALSWLFVVLLAVASLGAENACVNMTAGDSCTISLTRFELSPSVDYGHAAIAEFSSDERMTISDVSISSDNGEVGFFMMLMEDWETSVGFYMYYGDCMIDNVATYTVDTCGTYIPEDWVFVAFTNNEDQPTFIDIEFTITAAGDPSSSASSPSSALWDLIVARNT